MTSRTAETIIDAIDLQALSDQQRSDFCNYGGSRDADKIMEAAFSGDDAHIFVHDAEGDLLEDGLINSIGWVYIVLGNEGWDVISDYTTNLEHLMTAAHKISDHYSR